MTQGIYCLYFEASDSRYYVGKSLASIESRFKNHCAKLRNGTHGNYLLQKEFKLLQQVPILHIIEKCDDPLLIDYREIYWVEQLEAYSAGFNLTIGGEGSAPGANHPKALYTEEVYVDILKTLADNKYSIIDISRRLNLDYNIVSNIAHGQSHIYLSNSYPDLYNKVMQLNGDRTVGGRCHSPLDNYEKVFADLALTTLPMQVIADKNDVTLSVVVDINKCQSHKYLHDKFPEYYAIILSNRGKQLRFGKIWPKVVSPSGEIHEIINTVEFCKLHCLDSGGLSRLLNYKQTSTKGWRLHEPK